MVLATTVRSRLLGLKSQGAAGETLMLAPCRDVHTFGMRRAIDIAFVSEEGIVLESHREVAPRRRVRCNAAAVTLERYSDRNTPWFEPGEHVALAQERGMRPARYGRRPKHAQRTRRSL